MFAVFFSLFLFLSPCSSFQVSFFFLFFFLFFLTLLQLKLSSFLSSFSSSSSYCFFFLPFPYFCYEEKELDGPVPDSVFLNGAFSLMSHHWQSGQPVSPFKLYLKSCYAASLIRFHTCTIALIIT